MVLNLQTAPLPAPQTQPVDPLVAVVQPIEKEEPLKPVEYTVKSGDNLTKIGEAEGSSWLRLWQKNKKIKNPDLIYAGQVLIIPDPKEQLKNRPLPVQIAPTPVKGVKPAEAPRGSSSGNTYTYGYCTWYVKNRRPDLPNNLGNAITWTTRAAAQGIGTGSKPVPGAVGQKGNHVVYVESVSGSQMTISEMNYEGWNKKSSRTVSWSGWSFIY